MLERIAVMHASFSSHRLAVAAASCCLLTLLFVAASCGGGGGGDGAAPIVDIELGAMSATVPTRTERSWLNPLGGTAQITALPSDGPFSFDPANLPAVAPNGDLVVGGYFTEAGGQPADYVASWDGSSWSPLGTGSPSARWMTAITSPRVAVRSGPKQFLV